MKHLKQEELVLIYYREPEVPAEATAHLAECGQCRADFDSLAETLNACLDWTAPEPPLDFGRSVWAGLAPQLAQTRRRSSRMWFAIAAAAVLALSAFIAGRLSRPVEPSFVADLSPRARERIFAISMADHLDRAEMLLTELGNADDTDTNNFALERERARDLVQEGRLMRQVAAGRGETRILPLLDDVERLVLEVANAPDCAAPDEMRELKRSIGANSLLFKVRIIESNLRNEGRRS
jgi:hypothetical protein